VTIYQYIDPVQEPMGLMLDDQGRATCTFNINVTKRWSTTFLQELVSILEGAGVGALSVSIFVSPAAELPPDSDDAPAFLTIVATGGTTPQKTHNDIAHPAWTKPSARLTAHHRDYAVAEALAWAAYTALVRVRNLDVVP
jgi:hypothetical protein